MLGLDRLRADLKTDAMCANGRFEYPAASVNWVEHGSTLCVEVKFAFSGTATRGPKSGSVFRFFFSGCVYSANWDNDGEYEVQGREVGYRFTPPSVDPDEVDQWNGQLEHFIEQAIQFIRECVEVPGTNIVLEDLINT